VYVDKMVAVEGGNIRIRTDGIIARSSGLIGCEVGWGCGHCHCHWGTLTGGVGSVSNGVSADAVSP
jgi:hypothetical protein